MDKASAVAPPSTATFRPGTRGSSTPQAASVTSIDWPRIARGWGLGEFQEGRELFQYRRMRAVEQARPGESASVEFPQLLLQVHENVAGARVRHVRELVAVRDTGIVVDHRVPFGCGNGRVVRLGEYSARLGHRDPQGALLEDRGLAPESFDARDVLAGQDEVNALRTAAARDVFQQLRGLRGHLVASGEEVLEFVDHRDDPRPVPARVLFAQVGQVGDLVFLGRGRTAAQFVGEEAQQRQRIRGRC